MKTDLQLADPLDNLFTIKSHIHCYVRHLRLWSRSGQHGRGLCQKLPMPGLQDAFQGLRLQAALPAMQIDQYQDCKVREMSEHLLEMAKARVRIKDGKVEVMTDPGILCCPLRRDLYGIARESRESVQQILQGHMQELGMYGPHRVLELLDMPVSFGASEILSDALGEGLVDSAVVVCEGAGTVVASRPEVLQAIGAHMTGLIKTDPISEIQDGLEERGCLLLDRKAGVDQADGYKKAVSAGFRRIAVTVAGTNPQDAAAIRKLGQVQGNRPLLLAVHTTGISEDEATILAENCDLIWSCASKAVREVVGRRASLQMGVSIPVFAMTLEGKRLLLNRALHFPAPLAMHRAGLPLAPEGKQPEPLI
jgi:putative methanogenesis marker protein 8